MFSFILHHLFKTLILITTLYNKFILTIPIVFFEILFQNFFYQNNEGFFQSFNIILKTQNNNKKTCQTSVSFLLLSSVIVGFRP